MFVKAGHSGCGFDLTSTDPSLPHPSHYLASPVSHFRGQKEKKK